MQDSITAPPPDPAAAPDHAIRIAALEAELRSLREGHEALLAQFTALAELERYRDVILRRHAPPILPQAPSCRLEAADFAEQSDGLYYLEYGPRGEAYRWTGPSHLMRVRFNIDRSVPLKVALRLISLGSHTEQDTVTVEVEGTSYPMRLSPVQGTVLESEPIPPRPGSEPTELLFNFPVLFSPGNADDVDARQLGVAMQAVEMGPL